MGRPKAERNPAEGKPHKNLTSLAESLGVTVPAIIKWKSTRSDHPQTLIESEWREFISRHGLGGRSGRRADKGREELANEKLASEIRLNEIKIAKEERKLIPADEVESFLLYLASKTKSALYQRDAELAPKLAGLDVVEIRRNMREGSDVICLSMQTAVDDWRKEQEEARKAAVAAAEKMEDD